MTLREARFSRGISQQQLSLLSGVHQTTISHIERGLQEPNDKHKAAIQSALSCHPDLIDWELTRKEYLKDLNS